MYYYDEDTMIDEDEANTRNKEEANETFEEDLALNGLSEEDLVY